MRFPNQIVWITGASSGIGEALSRQFAADGADHAGAADALGHLDAPVPQLGRDERRRPHFLEPHLGMRMDVATQSRDSGHVLG